MLQLILRLSHVLVLVIAAEVAGAAPVQAPLSLPSSLSPSAQAPPVGAGAELVATFGVVVEFGIAPACTVVETDRGELLAPLDLGEAQLGQRVLLEGRVDPVLNTPCGGFALPSILDAKLHPAFAGTGRLTFEGGIAYLAVAPDERYALARAPAEPPGTRLFVRGPVSAAPPGAPVEFVLDNTVTGPAFRTFGRLAFQGQSWSVETAGGSVGLEQVGLAFPAVGDYVFVEGRRPGPGPGGGVPTRVYDNTTRRAFAHGGELVEGPESGSARFDADGLPWAEPFELSDLGGFEVGDRVYVRGRTPDDFDPLEPLDPTRIRDARVGAEVAGCGEWVPSGAGTFFLPEGGGPILVENALPSPTPGQAVYVTGTLDPDAPVPTFAHNLVAECWELSGTLVQGFECLPYFFSDQPAGGFLNLFLLENLGGFWIGDSFCVRGAVVPGCGTGCPVPCLVANVVEACDGAP